MQKRQIVLYSPFCLPEVYVHMNAVVVERVLTIGSIIIIKSQFQNWSSFKATLSSYTKKCTKSTHILFYSASITCAFTHKTCTFFF